MPICKFKVEMDGHEIEVDLNTNERLGMFATYAEEPRFACSLGASQASTTPA